MATTLHTENAGQITVKESINEVRSGLNKLVDIDQRVDADGNAVAPRPFHGGSFTLAGKDERVIVGLTSDGLKVLAQGEISRRATSGAETDDDDTGSDDE